MKVEMTMTMRSILEHVARTAAVAGVLLLPAMAAAQGPITARAILAKLGPAPTAVAAAADFADGKPAGALGVGFEIFNKALEEYTAKMHVVYAADSTGMTSAVPSMSDPKALADLQKKMETMTDQEKMAVAMQMSGQMMQGMKAQAQAAPPSIDDATMDRLSAAMTAMQHRALPASQAFYSTIAELGTLRNAWPETHRSIDIAYVAEVKPIPSAERGESADICYTPANAQRARQIALKYDDQHIALADRHLAQVAQWSAKIRVELTQRAQEDDALMQMFAPVEAASVRSPATRHAITGPVLQEHSRTLDSYIKPYAETLRDAELDVARWVYAKAKRRAAPLNTCA